jgi:alpha-galactosidase
LGLTTEDGPGLFAGWETNSRAFCDYGDLHGTGECAVDVWLEPNYRLSPGSTLVGPAGFLGAVEGDLDEVSYRTHRFVEDVIARPVDDPRFPYAAFNSWGYGPDIDDASMRVCFEKCRKLGVELFVVDFGWEDPDWHPLEDKFPQGLGPLADAAHEAGMQFGIHLSFGNVSSLSTMYREHPDWVNGPGQWAYHREGEAYALSLGHPDARDWITGKLIDIIDETRIDYFLTDHFLWGPVNPELVDMHATDDYMTTTEGFDIVLERVHEARPHVLMEHCDNGLGLPTFKMTVQHVTSIGPDAVGSQYERVGTWRLSRVLPPRYLDHYVCERHAPHIPFDKPLGDYEYRSQMFGGPMILMTDIMSIEEGSEEWNALARAIDLFKRIRHRVADGKVLHLLEPQPYERVGDGWDGWDAIGSYHEASDSAVILVFRLGGDRGERIIPVHGLNPTSQYEVRFEDRDDRDIRGGEELMANGIPLTLPRPGEHRNIDDLGFVRATEVIHLHAIQD